MKNQIKKIVQLAKEDALREQKDELMEEFELILEQAKIEAREEAREEVQDQLKE